MLIKLLKIRSVARSSIKNISQLSTESSIVFHHIVRLVFFEKKCKNFIAKNILLLRVIWSKSKNKSTLY